MTAWLRPSLLLAALIAALAAYEPARREAFHLGQQSLDLLDARPAQSVLIIGNSRTYFHDMPDMVRAIADSAHAPVRYAITTEAWGGASFEAAWNSAEVQRLLRRHWDHVILQSESWAAGTPDNEAGFFAYGEKLLSATNDSRSPAAVIVNWGYGEEVFHGTAPHPRADFIARTEADTRRLAGNAGAGAIDTSAVWEDVRSNDPRMPLYEDGNHPTVYGSYLSALMIYGFISGGDVTQVTYRPAGVDEASAQEIRRIVASHYANDPK